MTKNQKSKTFEVGMYRYYIPIFLHKKRTKLAISLVPVS